jgi:hypothetical protein
MAGIGHFTKVACTDRQPGEHAHHYWGFVVVGDLLTPVRLTEKQMCRATAFASRNMGDCPKPPGKVAEWVKQAFIGIDIKRAPGAKL